MKKGKIRFYGIFTAFVLLFLLVKWAVPSVAHNPGQSVTKPDVASLKEDTLQTEVSSEAVVDSVQESTVVTADCPDFNPDLALDSARKHKILSVASYKNSFPDINDVQLPSARRYGVRPVQNRAQAERMKEHLVYIGSSPYYHVEKLNSSIPYLVPRASKLLDDIAQAFHDSLTLKHIPLHNIIVTSALRTKDDVSKLQMRNGNATTTSCHLFGTTVDICYNRYKTVEDPTGPSRHKVRNDTLKWVLSEVLDDMRRQNRCYIKYEVHQGCFHLTVR